jgi:hypothetical protein
MCNLCAFANPVEQMVERIKQTNIVAYRLEWSIQEEDWNYVNIYEGNDKNMCAEIKNAMDDVMLEDNFTSEYIGILILVNKDGSEEKIYISSPTFIPEGGNTVLRGSFASPKLSGVIRKMLEESVYKGKIIIPENLFENLATVYQAPQNTIKSDKQAYENNEEKPLTEDDAIKMQDALIKYIENSKDEDIKRLLHDVKVTKPHLMENGTVHIGCCWQYDKKENVLSYTHPFESWGALWYYAEIVKENDSWKVKNIRRMEIFK